MNILIGNAIMFVASMIMVSLGMMKNKKEIIILQTLQIFMMAVGSIFLCTIPGAIICLFGCARNILAYHDKLTKNNKIILIILSSGFSLFFNNIGIWGLFPVVASILYVSFIDIEDITKYKLLEVSSTSLWLIHDLHVLAYTCVVFDILTIIANAITYVRLKEFGIPKIRILQQARIINNDY